MSDDLDPSEKLGSSAAVRGEFEYARSAGAWMPWAAFFCALGWWGAVAGGVLAVIGWDALTSAPAAFLGAGAMCALLPGIMLIMSGFMARESTRSARANAIVMDAAARLLSPSEHIASEAETFADQMRTSAQSVDKAMNHALSALKAMSGELGDERLRVESVAYASADNARELAERLAAERTALESLARDIRSQTNDMSEAIPRQAALMVEAAKAAGEEVAKADNSLEARLDAMQSGTEALARQLTKLDELARDASQRTETLTFAIARVEEKLGQSQKTVDQAVRAGEMAAAAAGTSGDALRDAVSVALDGARDASAAIQQRTREASEEAARALAALRSAGEEAASSIRAAGNAARSETDIVERRLANVSSTLSEVSRRTPEPKPAQLTYPNEVPADERGVNGRGVNGSYSNGHAAPPLPPEPPAEPPRIAIPMTPPQPAPAPAPAPSLAPPSDDELFEGETEQHLAEPEPAAPEPVAEPPMMDASALRDHLRGEPNDGGAVAPGGQVAKANGDTAWGDILADIDTPPVDAPPSDTLPEDPEEGVRILLERLQESGIELPKMFKPRDKRKIAAASKKGDGARREAVRGCASTNVDRVAGRLRGNPELRTLAEYFLQNEQDIALSYLEKTAKTGKHASPRLSAYLLIDAALA